MKGKLIIDVEEGTKARVSSSLKEVTKSDEYWLMHVLASFLDMSDDDITTYAKTEMSFRNTYGREDAHECE